MCTSKGFKSGLFIRVVAVLMTMRLDFAIVRHVKSRRAYFSYMYALVDEDGEVTPPQDKERRELPMQPEDLTRLRAVALQNVERMAESRFPLSPSWLEKLGPKYAMQARSARLMQDAALGRRPNECPPSAAGSTSSSRASPHREDDGEEL
eukprot:3762651-Pleurochrysis_carterae.AAC.1